MTKKGTYYTQILTTEHCRNGSDRSLEINKMFGPTIFCDIRITPDTESVMWIIERQNIKTGEWSEVCRIAGQFASECEDEV